MGRHFANIYRLGVKELWSLWRDPIMLVLIVYTFTLSVYTSARAIPETLHNAPIAIVDEDGSPLSARIASAFYPPQFTRPAMVTLAEMDPGMDEGLYTFVLNIPPNFQREVLAGRAPELQLNVDATRMSQAFSGSGYVQQIVLAEVNEFVQRYRGSTAPPVELALRARFNPALEKAWFGALMQIINNVTLLSLILTGAALIREREHGTIEHLLVMPVTPTEIMLAKVWAMALVVLVAAAVSLIGVVRGFMGVPIEGSVPLFLLGLLIVVPGWETEPGTCTDSRGFEYACDVPTGGTVLRILLAVFVCGALALLVAIPILFLHEQYQPGVALALGPVTLQVRGVRRQIAPAAHAVAAEAHLRHHALAAIDSKRP